MQSPNYSLHTTPELVSFSRVMAVFFALLSSISAYMQDWALNKIGITLLVISGIWLLTGLITPKILKPLFHGWMWFAYCLNFFMTRLILGVLFYFLMMPIALLMRIFGKDPLVLRTKADSYWKVRANPTRSDHFEELYCVQSGQMGGQSKILELASQSAPLSQPSET
jgi:hypothetical protein